MPPYCNSRLERPACSARNPSSNTYHINTTTPKLRLVKANMKTN